MSWQEYVDNQLMAHKLSHAAIVGSDGSVWAKDAGFQVTKDEMSKLVTSFKDPSSLFAEGLHVAGCRFVYLSGEADKIIRAKKGKIGLHCVKTHQAVILGVYEDPIQPQQAATVVEKLADYLIENGY